MNERMMMPSLLELPHSRPLEEEDDDDIDSERARPRARTRPDVFGLHIRTLFNGQFID